MSDVVPILRAIEFIEDHLQDALRIADVAEAARYSMFHFCRTFSALTHHSPYDYLMRRRLSEAARALIQTGRKVIDVALDFQFNSPETFSRAFRRMFDMQPRQWRTAGRLDRRLLMPRLSSDHLAYRNRPDFAWPTLEEREPLQVMGLMMQTDEQLVAVAPVWNALQRELEGHAGATETASYYGVICYPESWTAGNLFYLAAAALDGPPHAHSALVAKTLPAGRYACISHAGGPEWLPLALDYIYHTWLSKKGLHPYSPLVIESYGAHFQMAGQRTILIPVQ